MSLSIVPFSERHLDQVVDLFLLSLGDEGGVPTPEYWRWKHVANPFGVSPTLLMMDGEKVVGIRAFMAWKWRLRGKVYQAYRCVDTATHPDYRGRGIFKKLTLELLDRLGPQRADFIFNTPNEMSRPGYLKMGWEVAGEVPLYLRPVPGGLLSKEFTPPDTPATPDPTFLDSAIDANRQLTTNSLTTDYSAEYFRWRYVDIPDLQYYYHALSPPHRAFCYYRLKQTKGINELRITDMVYGNRKELLQLLREIVRLAKRIGAAAVSLLKPPELDRSTLLLKGFVPFSAQAMTLTKRKVGDHSIYNELTPGKTWDLSAGAVELF